MILINCNLLRKTISKKGLKLKYIAKCLNLSDYGLLLKLNGKNEFKVSEVNLLIEALSLTKKEVDSIFFAQSVHLKGTN